MSICQDCDGRGGVWVDSHGKVFRHLPPVRAVWVDCWGCGGSGITSCCEGAVGCAADVTNKGSPDNASTFIINSNRRLDHE